MLLLARFHFRDQACCVRFAFDALKHGALAAIDLHRAVLPGVIDADHLVEAALGDAFTRHGRVRTVHAWRLPVSAM